MVIYIRAELIKKDIPQPPKFSGFEGADVGPIGGTHWCSRAAAPRAPAAHRWHSPTKERFTCGPLARSFSKLPMKILHVMGF